MRARSPAGSFEEADAGCWESGAALAGAATPPTARAVMVRMDRVVRETRMLPPMPSDRVRRGHAGIMQRVRPGRKRLRTGRVS